MAPPQQVLKPLSVSTKIHMLPTSVMLENIIQNIQSTPLYIDSVSTLANSDRIPTVAQLRAAVPHRRPTPGSIRSIRLRRRQ
jgi:hypothetical protein